MRPTGQPSDKSVRTLFLHSGFKGRRSFYRTHDNLASKNALRLNLNFRRMIFLNVSMTATVVRRRYFGETIICEKGKFGWLKREFDLKPYKSDTSAIPKISLDVYELNTSTVYITVYITAYKYINSK